MSNMSEKFSTLVRDLQNQICRKLEAQDTRGKFIEDVWQRADGGGGITRILERGHVIEKGGVNTSAVFGPLTDAIRKQLKLDGTEFFATGISLVIHPINPMVPTVHANFRYFEVYDEKKQVLDSWFGGGADLTPYYLFEPDCIDFHRALQTSCAILDKDAYSSFKEICDNYFVNTHRNNERRGIGGIFYDHQRPGEKYSADQLFEFARDCAERFIDVYIEIMSRRKELPFTENQVYWQQIRRGRYIEFNLLHDRGTTFGLKSNGRTESILMSLPAQARFDYHDQPIPGSEEEKLTRVLLNPRDWL